MGNSSGSMFYALAGFMILYFAGMIIFRIYDAVHKFIRKKRGK